VTTNCRRKSREGKGKKRKCNEEKDDVEKIQHGKNVKK
jgi:hypothetical protein